VRLLAIDTSNQTLSIAICEDQRILGEYTTTVKKNHSLTLMPAINDLTKAVGLSPQDIDRLVVAKGPGSYTGLRIGVTTAKTLAYTLKKELVGVSSLKVVAANCVGTQGIIVPLFDARRNNVYAGAYTLKQNQWQTVLKDQHIALASLLEQLQEFPKVSFVGADVEKFKDIIAADLPNANVITIPQWQIPHGTVLAELGRTAEPVTDIHGFLPDYLKKVEAEENWLKTHQVEDTNYVEKL
jgi:tRNA threonylcarbamoyladenosine biosynthesis protein TsaB